mmetsp:Transcript_29869/g.79812  ORF Transcript_29869/g.79812 Transcript_29869/m.79812 type:complete len:341 (-) Transcript_29869:199-1221(-)
MNRIRALVQRRLPAHAWHGGGGAKMGALRRHPLASSTAPFSTHSAAAMSRLELQPGGPHSRLVCLGDCHGDKSAFERQLQVAQVIDAEGNWCGGSDVLVQIGDVLDRGVGELHILLRLADLTKQAAAAGGRVIQLMGNHELMNYCADWRYVSGPWGDGFAPFADYLTPALDEKAPGWRELPALAQLPHEHQARAAAFDVRVPCLVDEIRPLRMGRQVAVIVGDTLCVHGGLAMPHLDFVGGFDALNEEAEEWVETGGDGSGRAPPLLEHPNGPLWMRIFSNPSDTALPYVASRVALRPVALRCAHTRPTCAGQAQDVAPILILLWTERTLIRISTRPSEV